MNKKRLNMNKKRLNMNSYTKTKEKNIKDFSTIFEIPQSSVS